jgi:hypothetical protein
LNNFTRNVETTTIQATSCEAIGKTKIGSKV